MLKFRCSALHNSRVSVKIYRHKSNPKEIEQKAGTLPNPGSRARAEKTTQYAQPGKNQGWKNGLFPENGFFQMQGIGKGRYQKGDKACDAAKGVQNHGQGRTVFKISGKQACQSHECAGEEKGIERNFSTFTL